MSKYTLTPDLVKEVKKSNMSNYTEMTTKLSIKEIYNKLFSIAFLNGEQTHNFVVSAIGDIFEMSKSKV